MSWPRLLLIADHGASGGDGPWLDLVARLVGLRLPVAAAVQLRVKDAAPQARARLLTAALSPPRSLPVLVNGTLAEAVELGADGVHWAEAAIPDAPAGDDVIVAIRGASVHSEDAVRRAATAGATYVVFAPVYAPRSKPGAGLGLEALRRIASRSPLPVLALGGIGADRVEPCLRAGAAGVAVLGALLDGPDPTATAARLAETLTRR